MEPILATLRAREADYQPQPAVAEALNAVTLVPIIGPFAVGKSTCMNKVLALDPEFGQCHGFTTRDKRPDDSPNEFRWLPHDGLRLNDILQAAEAGQLVQYAVHPTTGRVYGSDLRDYAHPFTLIASLSSAVPSLRALPFRSTREITLVASVDEWRVMSRPRLQQMTPAERQKRLREGAQSLAWSLDAGDAVAWVHNRNAALTNTAKEVIGLARGTRQPEPRNRRVGEQLLKHFNDLLAAERPR